MLACMLDEREMGFIQQEQKRVILQNNYYLMSVSLQFGRRLWNSPFVGFKLPTNELKNTKIKYTATLKHAQTPNAHHCRRKKQTCMSACMANDINCFPTSESYIPAHTVFHGQTPIPPQRATEPYCTWCQASTARAAVQHEAMSQQHIW